MKKILLLSLITLVLAVPLAFSVEQRQVDVLLAYGDDVFFEPTSESEGEGSTFEVQEYEEEEGSTFETEEYEESEGSTFETEEYEESEGSTFETEEYEEEEGSTFETEEYEETGDENGFETEEDEDVGNIIYSALISLANWFFSFLIAIALIGMVVSGIMFVFAGGDPGKATTARNIAIYSLIGVLVGSLGWILVNWVKSLVP